MRVYRSAGGAGYQFLGYIEGGPFIDTYETAEEAPGGGTLLETIAQVPWCNHACASVDGIVAWACDKETPAPFKVYVSSSPDQPLSVGEEYDIDPRYGPITALARCGENFLVFTARSIQAITPTSGRATVITAGMGCIGPRAWCETPHGIAFASIYGPAFLPRCTGDPRYVGPDPEQFALRDLWAEMFSADNGRTTQTIDIAQYKVRCLHVPEIPAVLWFFQRAKWPTHTSTLPYTFDTAIMWEYGRRDERLTVHDLLCVQDVLLTPEGTPRPLCWLWPDGWKRIFGKDVTEEIVQYTGLSRDGYTVSGFPAEQVPGQGDVLYVSSGTGQMTGDVQRMVDHVVVSVGCGGVVITAGEPVLGEDSTVWLNGFPWVVDIGPIVPAEPELVKRWTRISVETAQ
ncbi:MAG: hypothetical protein DRI48_11345 [Chloroflexi bacterium]|nr:MAG: hypothetical protein DRI48_11345 [Chloroflexota bacterium]